MAETLSREQIMGADDRPSEVHKIPEWGGSVRIRALSASQRGALEAEAAINGKTEKMLSDFRLKLVAMSLVDDDGHPLFTVGDLEEIGSKSSGSIRKISEIASRLSGLTEQEQEEIEGNLSEGQSEDSPSA